MRVALAVVALSTAAAWPLFHHGAEPAPWPQLREALRVFPPVHDRNLRAFEAGDPAARIVRVKVRNGLGNREQALLSSFALALASDAALVVEWPSPSCAEYRKAIIGSRSRRNVSRSSVTPMRRRVAPRSRRRTSSSPETCPYPARRVRAKSRAKSYY